MTSSIDKGENIKKIERFVEASKANAVVFPEFSNFYIDNFSPEEAYKMGEDESSDFIKEVERLAKKHEKWMIVGVYEKSEDYPKLYSTAFVINPKGEIELKYRKTHIFRALGQDESKYLKGSDNPLTVFSLEGFKVGLMICYEIRFPEIARTLALKGAEVILVPSAWLKGYNKEEQWITLAKARAMENVLYVLTSNQIGNAYAGISLGVDPMGVLKARAGEGEESLSVEVSKEKIKEARKLLPLLEQRRKELYQL